MKLRIIQLGFLIAFLFEASIAQNDTNTTNTNATNTTQSLLPKSVNLAPSNKTKKCYSAKYNNSLLVNWNDSDYCAALMSSSSTWKISEDTLSNFYDYQTNAITKYKQLYQKWLNRKASDEPPDNDCLGMARVAFCAAEYPFCNEDTQTDDNVVCSFICKWWKDRCPSEMDTYNDICSNISESNCSIAGSLGISAIACLLTALFTLFS